MKKSQTIKTFLFILAAVAISGGTAYAGVDINGGNDTTGPNSENHNRWEIEYEAEVDIDNHSDLDNEFVVSVENGGNKINNNTEVGDITTGDIEGDISFENELNDMAISFSNDDPYGDIEISLANDTTGTSSENHNRVELSYERDLRVRNHADIDNSIVLSASTGNNTVKNNTVVGDITTGDVDVTSDVSNTTNSSFDVDLSGYGTQSDISVDLANGTTGPNSSNRNSVEIEQETEVHLDNHADIDNNYTAEVNTGENKIKSNTVVGDITTGSISIEYHGTNTAN